MNKAKRNNKGQFVETTGARRYKTIQRNGRSIGEHVVVFLDAVGLNKLPDGFTVHHLDGDGKNNDINNLAMITITSHNRIHAHEAWNKGLKASVDEKWGKTIKKSQEERFKTFLPLFKKAFELQTCGKKLREIAVIQGISRRQVSDRIKRYKTYVRG